MESADWVFLPPVKEKLVPENGLARKKEIPGERKKLKKSFLSFFTPAINFDHHSVIVGWLGLVQSGTDWVNRKKIQSLHETPFSISSFGRWDATLGPNDVMPKNSLPIRGLYNKALQRNLRNNLQIN